LSNHRKRMIAIAAAALALATLGAGTAGADGWGDSSRDDRRPDCSDRQSGRDLNVVGYTDDNRLICFSASRPDDARTIGRVMGLDVDTKLLGIDFRPATGELVGLGDAGGVYTIDVDSAQAMKKSTINKVLFNPTVDRLRVTSDTGQNLRVNVDTGDTLEDADLNYTAGTPAMGIVGSAYTNNDADPNTATTLFDLDSVLDQIAIQAPPNAGSLNPTGKLGVDTGATVGFDIYSKIRNGTTVDVRAFASLTTGSRSELFEVNLFTGSVDSQGDFSTRNQVVGIAIPLT
jgi:hypothetical protein